MKLRMLVATAGCLIVPAIAVAQTPPTDTTKRDTTATTTTTTTTEPTATTSSMSTTSSGQGSRPVKDSIPGPRPTPPSDGKSCPWGCPTSSGAAGLSGVQFLALQQELRDRLCGKVRITGRLDAPTRNAIRVCARKMGVANNARAVLAAMDVGYSASDLGGTGTSGNED